jgi:hypothetical protein
LYETSEQKNAIRIERIKNDSEPGQIAREKTINGQCQRYRE